MLNKRELSLFVLACSILVALVLMGLNDPATAQPSPVRNVGIHSG